MYIYTIYYTCSFTYVELFLYLQGNVNLIMVTGLDISLYSACYIIDDFFYYAHEVDDLSYFVVVAAAADFESLLVLILG